MPEVSARYFRSTIWIFAVAASILAQLPWLGLFQDVRFTFGSLRAGQATGLTAAEIFVHRPMLNRLLMSGLDTLSADDVVTRERLILSAAIVAAGLAGAGSAKALRAWLPEPGGTCVGLAVFAALAWPTGLSVLQPEWTAVLLGVAGLALALVGGPATVPTWRSPLLATAGAVLAVAALQKYTTATTVVLVCGILFVLDRRRGWIVGCWTALATLTFFAMTVIVEPREWQWFVEMPYLNGPSTTRWESFGHSLGNLAWTNPAVTLWPAATLLGSSLSKRRIWYVGPLVAFAVVAAGAVVQNAFFPYHYAALPVLAAGLVALAAALWWRETGTIPLGIAAVAPAWIVAASWMGHHPFSWRVAHPHVALGGAAVTALVSTVLTWWQVRNRPSTRTEGPKLWLPLWATAAVALAVTFPGWPGTPYGYSFVDMSRTSETGRRAAGIEMGSAIRTAAGAGPVAYLTFGDMTYFVGLPTRCVYPTAVFLYRSADLPTAKLTSFQENLSCLRDPAARFLVLQTSAATKRRVDPEVTETIRDQFDCKHPVARTRSMLLCPRR